LHGDYWPGNLLWNDGKLAAVLDWEDAERGDPLADIALARLDICWAFGDAASVYAGAPISRPDIDERSMREGHRRFVAEAVKACGRL
jgi:aminoglycoside phosphotransferase (APT) family kinase protein